MKLLSFLPSDRTEGMFVIVGSNSKFDNIQISFIVPPSSIIVRCKFAFATFQFRQIEFISNSYGLEAKQTALRQFWMWWWHWVRGGAAQIFSWPRMVTFLVSLPLAIDGVVFRAPFSVFLKKKQKGSLRSIEIVMTSNDHEIHIWYWVRSSRVGTQLCMRKLLIYVELVSNYRNCQVLLLSFAR